ncbi:uncharacterized protein IUM83_18803 [Phytophthora cinnamomi]|uniref:uncharacterized protein n=1 Tax=Phytophthora cinnamomi TaxID=4785 RepID=UPI002A2BBB6F|nr:hypothetical protein IUM83_18803 [Phytophthora cinnamomi]KAJ8577595.1 hypothetical protein ON010_g1613 [Phytophthora cinnamomi]
MNSKRSLRGLKTTDNAADEERTLNELFQKFETTVAKVKPAQYTENLKLEKIAKREAFVKQLVNGGKASYEDFSKKRVTFEEYAKALGVTDADYNYKILALKPPRLIIAEKYSAYLDKELMSRGFLKTRFD